MSLTFSPVVFVERVLALELLAAEVTAHRRRVPRLLHVHRSHVSLKVAFTEKFPAT